MNVRVCLNGKLNPSALRTGLLSCFSLPSLPPVAFDSTAVHYNTFVAGSVASVATIVAAVRMMSHENQQEVLRQLSQSAGQ